MVQKNKNKNKGKNKGKKHVLPFVSICTPTFNRRPFFEGAIKCVLNQDYPQELLEWIIIDDGTDHIEDLVKDIDIVKYFKYDEKMKLGKKRNLMHSKCKGSIIVYFDDDDYYPPERVSHSVNMLLTHPKSLCAGSSELNLYFNHNETVYKFGPYGPNHATAGTFAFKKELLENNNYDDDAALAEERHFLKGYTVPFVQLESKKTILVISHKQNTFDKKMLLGSADKPGSKIKSTDSKLNEFIKNEEMLDFYSNKIHKLIENYAPGRPEMKPDVVKQTNEILKKLSNNGNDGNMRLSFNDGKIVVINNNTPTELSQEQIFKIIQQIQTEKNNLRDENEKLKEKLKIKT